MATTPRGRKHQRRRYQQAQRQLEERLARNAQKRASKRKQPEKMVLSPTDPQAALGRDKEGVYRPLYNAQTVDDLDSPLVLAYEVFAQPNDQGTLEPMLQRHAQLLGGGLQTLLADSAFASGAHLALAETKGVSVYTSVVTEATTPSSRSCKVPPQFPKSQFRWEPESQTYRCPEGHRLVLEGRSVQKRSGPEPVVLLQYRCAPVHCQACPQQRACTPNPARGRTISRSENEESIERLQVRMATAEAKALYKLRGQTVELSYADLKEHRQLRRFYCWGLARVRTVVGLNVLVHNLLAVFKAQQSQTALPPLNTTHSRSPP